MTAEIENRRRDLFEAHYRKLGWKDVDFRREFNGEYYWGDVADKFDAWNAALDAVEIELPDIHPLPDGDGLDDDPDIWEMQMDIANSANSMRGRCAKAITATGLGLRIK